jgi:hypothetical protein
VISSNSNNGNSNSDGNSGNSSGNGNSNGDGDGDGEIPGDFTLPLITIRPMVPLVSIVVLSRDRYRVI